MKREGSYQAIRGSHSNGPIFRGGSINGADISIGDHCNMKDTNWIQNDGKHGYECDKAYQSSLFVPSDKPDTKVMFVVEDYEVYSIKNYKEFVYLNYKYPVQIWSYIERKEITDNALMYVKNELDILNDLQLVGCKDHNIKLRISHLMMKNPSQYLPVTQIVSKEYDDVLKEWLGNDSKWKLLYRASEHDYTAKSFHECCDGKGPTLIVIKSDGGWIFGGYTTAEWTSERICVLLVL